MQNTYALAGCIITDEHGGVMVLHRSLAGRSQWEIPGGKIEAGETPEAAAIRELKEEMGVDIRITEKLGRRTFTEAGKVLDYTWFMAEIISGEPVLQELATFDKWGYFSLVTLTTRYDELSAGTKSFLEAMAYGEIELDI